MYGTYKKYGIEACLRWVAPSRDETQNLMNELNGPRLISKINVIVVDFLTNFNSMSFTAAFGNYL